MESIQNFNKGMDLDTNPLNLEKGKYREANNIRLINDVSSTSFSVNNIKGNLLNLTIPSLPVFSKIELVAPAAAQTLTINGQTGIAFDSNGMTPTTLYNYIVSSGVYTFLGTQYNIYAGASYLIVVPIGAFTVTMSSTASLVITASYIPAQSSMEVIGSVNVRDDIYLFTTSNKTKNPGGHSTTITAVDAASVGQIWKYNYNKISLVGTLTLIYNDYVDFSTYYAIAPTATLGRYENSGTQRIYWTDNFNKLRSLNVADSNALALDPTLLNIVPAADFDEPILTDIKNASGSVKVGTYQCAYRLKNTGGAVTNYGPLSKLINVVPSDEALNIGGGGPWQNYYGGGLSTTTTKQMTWTINNLDTDYDRIEVVIVYRTSINDPATVIQIYDDSITSTEYIVVFDGTQDESVITLDEFIALSGTFTHCKTIGTKDNRLFAANIRTQSSDIDFDARAFRAFTSGGTDVYLVNNGAATGSITPAAAEAFPQTDDTINDYTGLITNACYYRPGTANLGGSGLNIAYEFYTEAVVADVDTNSAGPFGVADFVGAPWRHTNPEYTTGAINLGVKSFTDNYTQTTQSYPTLYNAGIINGGFKYPPYTSCLKGYQRGEIYRFGIQLFDKSKNPVFVKWIGDIKMPDFFDVNNNSFFTDGTATAVNDFRLSFIANHSGSYNECFVQTLGIKFFVNIPPSISKLIDGYSIVRVKREQEDKSIVSQGYLTFAETDATASANLYTTSLSINNFGNQSAVGLLANYDRGFFVTPDTMYANLVAPAAGMKLKVKAAFSPANTDSSIVLSGGDPYYMLKYYNFNTLTAAQAAYYNIEQMTHLQYAGDTTDSASGKQVFNYDYNFAALDTTTSYSVCNDAYYFRTGAVVNYTDVLPAGAHPEGKLLANVERTLTAQYGGNTYTARANNTYIACSHYRPVRTATVTLPDVFEVYGGDTYVNMYDSCRWAKNWGASGRGVVGANKFSCTFYYPVESVVNTDLRSGQYMNKDISTGFEGGGYEMHENNDYNTIYSSEDNIKEFYPKPDPFILNEEFDNRFYASEIKINGEFTDSWGVFKTNNYWDVEGTYGPINAMDILKDKMYFWQNRAFGIIQINPRAVITDVNAATNAQLQIGTGLPLQRHDYLSTEIGLQHQWGVTKSSYKLFWLDVNNKKFFTYADGQSITPESDIKGLFSFLNTNLKNNILTTDKPVFNDYTCVDNVPPKGINGVRCIYDFKYNQAIFTITDGIAVSDCDTSNNNFTLAYDERINAFTAFYGFTPKVYFGDGYKIFSTDNLNANSLSKIYMHDVGPYAVFYGVLNDSTIKMSVNDNPQYTKAFDNIMYDSQATDSSGVNYNDDTWSTIRVYNDYQNTDYQSLVTLSNIKRKERTWQLAIPRNRVLYTTSNSPDIFTDLSATDKLMGERMRDKYITIDLTYTNATNRNLAFNNLRTLYRQSPR